MDDRRDTYIRMISKEKETAKEGRDKRVEVLSTLLYPLSLLPCAMGMEGAR